MNGIGIKSGVNDCHWNLEGKCTNAKITRAEPTGISGHDWDSSMNCTLTQLGVVKCNEYLQQGRVP